MRVCLEECSKAFTLIIVFCINQRLAKTKRKEIPSFYTMHNLKSPATFLAALLHPVNSLTVLILI